jgi:hypothetical protein
MSVFRTLRVRRNMVQRLGAYRRAREQGFTDEQARSYSDQLYPPTADDLAYEASLRDSSTRSLPIASTLSLLYPVLAGVYVGRSAPLIVAVGYVLSNFAYVLLAAGILRGTFLVLGLRRRLQVFALSGFCFLVGITLCNVHT